MAFFGQKWKKERWILKGNEKFALQKCLYFYSKMHRDQDIRLFIFFSLYPFGGIFTHQKMKKICQNQKFPLIYMHTQLNMQVPKKFKEILLLWYALMVSNHPLDGHPLFQRRSPTIPWMVTYQPWVGHPLSKIWSPTFPNIVAQLPKDGQ